MKTKYKFQVLIINSLFAFLLSAFFLTDTKAQTQTDWPHETKSKDGTSISYEVYGSGEPTLVFVHGWSCDSRYWSKQIELFSEEHKIVLIDLAGHGHSGTKREVYSMEAFGEDVKAVVDAIGSENVILVGHSMGDAVISQAALLMPERVKALIGIDNFDNIEYQLSQEDYEMMFSPLKENFQEGTRQFVQQMIIPTSDSVLSNWIIEDMAAAPTTIALSAMDEYLSYIMMEQFSQIFGKIQIPVITVHCDLWPIDYEANRRHMLSFDAIIIENSDHFLMMNKADEFNKALKQAIENVLKAETVD